MNLAHPSFGGLTIGQCTYWSNCKEIKQGNPFSYLKLFKTKNISPVKKRAKTNFTQRYCRVTEIMLGLGFFLLSWVVSARVVPWRIPWHHSPAALSLCRTNWKIYSLHLASDVLKWDCPAPLSANNEFYENRLISSFAFKILLNSLHPTFSPMHQSKMRPLLKLCWCQTTKVLPYVYTHVCASYV